MSRTEEIWYRFSTHLKSFILSKIQDKAVAGDILQEVFIKIHTKMNTLKDDTKLQPWLYQITRNLIADYYRGMKRENRQVFQETDDREEETGQTMMETAVRDMIQMMDNMPAAYCEALCLTELEGLSQAEYAEKMGIPYSSAKSRIQRSRKLLQEMLMKCCHYHFDKYGTVLQITPGNCCCCKPPK